MRVQLHGQEQNSQARLRNLWKILSQRCIQRDMPDGFACRTFDTSPKKRTEYACMAENAVVVKHELDGTYTNVEVAREQLHTMVNIDGHGGGFFHIIPEGLYDNDKVQICSRCAFGFSKCLVITQTTTATSIT